MSSGSSDAPRAQRTTAQPTDSPRDRATRRPRPEHEVHLGTETLVPQRKHKEDLPDALLRRVKQYSGRLSIEAVKLMDNRLDFFAELDASQRASVQMLTQTALINFLEWLDDPDMDIRFSFDAFNAPQEIARQLTLRQTVDMVRVAMDFFEQWLPALARDDRQLTVLTQAVLRYGRELGFAAAGVYASAAESRSAWDTRLEALVVDAVVRGDTGPDMLSRAATLNWDASAPATVVVGSPPSDQGVPAVARIHTIAEQRGRSALAVIQGSRVVAVLSGQLDNVFVNELLGAFSNGPVVIGPTMPSLTAAHTSASEALAGIGAVAGWRTAPRPVHASDLLPERALLGDTGAIAALSNQIVEPLERAGGTLADTLDAYLDCGGAVENCARQLYIHPNTVRYRLKRIAEITRLDPLNPRDAYVLRTATTVGRLLRIDNEAHQMPTHTSDNPYREVGA